MAADLKVCDVTVLERTSCRLARAGLAATLVALALVLAVQPAQAQFATIAFPDTAVGATRTVKCPDTAISLCFGDNCSGSGTVQSLNGPAAPFSVAKLNLLSVNEFFAGSCEAHPVTLPVTVGSGQTLAYQATFAPTAAGSFDGSLTINTSGGPAQVNLTGKGTAQSGGSGRALVTLEINSETFVPGTALDLAYRTKPQTLQGKADFYFVVQLPGGSTLFLDEAGALGANFVPFKRNVTVVDERVSLAVTPLPVDLPFGTYTFFMGLGYAGMTPNPANLAPFLASNVAQATMIYAPLSADQQTLLGQRGRPDILSLFWFDTANQKSESWLYLSTSPPTRFRFVNGALQGQESAPDITPGVGPKFDPAAFTPQLTPGQLTERFGQPTSTRTLPGGIVLYQYASGLDVVFQNGVLSSVNTFVP